MVSISSAPAAALVRLPLIRTVEFNGKLLLKIVGSALAPIGSADNLYLGPDGYTADPEQAQSFATTEVTTIESPGAPGKSAYELWLEAGNEGSMSAYMAYMAGKLPTTQQVADATAAYLTANPPAAGAKGDQGEPGEPGAAGPKGDTGTAGTNGTNGADGKSVEIQNAGGYIQWRQVGGSWNDLIAISALVGPSGQDGATGATGAAGKYVELRIDSGNIQWRQEGGSWANLVALSTLKGDTGAAGQNSIKYAKTNLASNTSGVWTANLGANLFASAPAVSVSVRTAAPIGYYVTTTGTASTGFIVTVTFWRLAATVAVLGGSTTVAITSAVNFDILCSDVTA